MMHTGKRVDQVAREHGISKPAFYKTIKGETRGQRPRESGREVGAGRGDQGAGAVEHHAAPPEHVAKFRSAPVEQFGGVAGDEFSSHAGAAAGALSDAAGADRQRQPFRRRGGGRVARSAGDVAIAAQLLVEHERLTKQQECGIGGRRRAEWSDAELL